MHVVRTVHVKVFDMPAERGEKHPGVHPGRADTANCLLFSCYNLEKRVL